MSKKALQDKTMLTVKEKRLIDILFSGGATEQDIAMFTRDLDVDTESPEYMLMLSYLGFSIQWKWFPKEIVPRIQELHRYYQVRNALGLKGLIERVGILDKAGIPVMLIKGMAMRHYYSADVPRIMADMDLLVPEEKFEQAISLLCASGGTEGVRTTYATHILNGAASVDLHKWLFKHHGEQGEDIWKRAVKINFYGKNVYVPAPEDMFVHQLDTRARAVITCEAESRRMRWLYDCRNICVRDSFDWELVWERIRQFHIENTAYFMLKAFSDCFPDLLSDSLVENMLPRPEKYEKWLRLAMRYRKVRKKFNIVQKGNAFWRYAYLWIVTKYRWYRLKRIEFKIMSGAGLSPVQYIKMMYCQKSVRGSIRLMATSVMRRAKLNRRKDGV